MPTDLQADGAIATIVRRLWHVRPRPDVDGWPRPRRVTVTWRSTTCTLWLSGLVPLREDGRRVWSALCATAAGLGRSDRVVRTVDLADVADYAEQWRAVDRLELPPGGGSR